MTPGPAGTVITAERIIFPVTEAHIGSGRPGMGCGDHIALAIMDAIPSASWAMVCYGDAPDWARAWVDTGGRQVLLALGRETYDSMLAFDMRQPVSPFTITAELRS